MRAAVATAHDRADSAIPETSSSTARTGEFCRSIAAALSLHRRGEARRDGLSLVGAENLLRIRWRARLPHPWDRDFPQGQIPSAFDEQLLADTEAAAGRLFEFLPQLDLVDLTVLEPASNNVLLAGTVSRADLQYVRNSNLSSIRMRLLRLGVQLASTENIRLD